MTDDEARHSKRSKGLIIGAAILIFGLLVCLGVLAWKYIGINRNTQKADTVKSAGQPTTEDVIAKVNKIYMLPQGEEPSVAQIQDKSKLSGGQPFYKHAKDGDYVLVYNKSKLALLYRESDNRLITVMPINLDSQSPSNTNEADQ